ncbi:BTAD domain-containing putative transcriptional regulator [Streptomyces rapamycinicus]|uniref:OmpR/PhoB-type domain-containing protein n=2 Tax=Streptomyces rapamycinicus TaxID=1226757 RepID=A0A0A0NXE0_STRRN|nr:BTAD domain-containing putative transcriptional regulator [Streptomyces rapamycinicus]AGP61365.1 hypothetical protein M271_50020 [Streptomyces rapamycinicus NRRL 5491]MBB4787451.1 DNA-binding SARP family transcriptional activator [Streptomyces rapamycinicus]RLV71796.1 hypothetical protein D3C57_144755 [Streptomyces rapamycinicus NRRL 5491]UTP36831.1 AAA family ATPase [Streptomyces rapamycinicus NRRL 5491]
MRFNVLGPLQVVSDGAILPMGGPKKRAVLGYLLVHANEVVATSQMIKVIWPQGAPSTARKMLQNTVSWIRSLLAEHDLATSCALLTHSPGYLLRVDESMVDLLRFERLTRIGREALADGRRAEATRTLREALDLWRGPALEDLTDTGITWPRLVALQEKRLTTLEDYLEAEIAVGHHHEQVAELDQLVAAEPHRERACRLLMIALYRCGRQVDALRAYQRTRKVLMDDLALEPTRELRELETRILAHDVSLHPAGEPELRLTIPGAAHVRPEPMTVETVPDRVSAARRAGGEPVAPPPRPTASTGERKLVSILTTSFDLGHEVDPEDVDDLLADLAAAVRAEAELAGGTVVCCTGSAVQAVFGVPRTGEQDMLTAVRTALVVRDRFAAREDVGPLTVAVRLSVNTEEILIKTHGVAPLVVSPAIDTCLRRVWSLLPDTVWICEATRRSGGADLIHDPVPYSSPTGPPLWRATGLRGDPPYHVDIPRPPLVDRDHDLMILQEHLDLVVRRGRGRILTLVGEAGMGKSRLVLELARLIRRSPDRAKVLRTGTVHGLRTATADPLTALVASWAGLSHGCTPEEAEAEVTAAVSGLLGEGSAARSLTRGLLPLFVPGGRVRGGPDDGAVHAAVVDLLTQIAGELPVVLVVEDLHAADDDLLRFLGLLAGRVAAIPLLLISTARPQLASRRVCSRASTTMTLDRLTDAAVRELWASVLRREEEGDGAGLTPELFDRIGGNPMFAIEFARQRLHEPDGAPEGRLPARIYRVVAARLDRLEPEEKEVLKEATLVSGPIVPDTVAALGCRTVEVVRGCLDELTRRHLLVRELDGRGYTFAHPVIRDVAHAQLPKATRSGADRRAGALRAG